jgi:hypothetical protein
VQTEIPAVDRPGLAFDSKGYFSVCDAGNQRIQKFKIPGP